MSIAKNEKREMLRHFLAALAYRTQKALREAPEGFSEFSAGNGVRTPHQLICHMRSVLGYARTFFLGGEYARPVPVDFAGDIEAFHELLAGLSRHLEANELPIGTSEENLLQGPLSDAMTHAGQLAMLRRLYGEPVPSENFIVADISSENVTENQPAPVSPDADWLK